MKKGKKYVVICMALSCLLSMTACNKQEMTTSKERSSEYYSVTIDGEYIEYNEDHPDVIGLGETAIGFLTASINKDYNNLNPTAEYGYYLKSVSDQYIASGVPENTKTANINNEIVMHLDETVVQGAELFKIRGQEAGRITVQYISTIEHATQAYLDRIGVEASKKYRRSMTITMLKEEGQWRIQEYSLTAREAV